MQASADRAGPASDHLGCNEQTVRNAVHAFNTRRSAGLDEGLLGAHTIHRALDAAGAERLRDLLHRSPRDFGYATSLWTLDLAAKEAFAKG